MAKVILNSMIQEAHGKFGDYIFRRSHNGEIILTITPDMSNVKWSEAQEAHRQRFKEAVAYAKAAMVESEVRVIYEKLAAEKRKRPFDMAVSDYFKGRNLLSSRSD